MPIAAASGPLAPFRVLDLTDELGHLAGRMLAELGADVIKLEPPNAGGARLAAPFYHDEPHPERSLLWWTLNHSKRSITIDLNKPRGAELFLQLVDGSDFVVESTPPGAMESVGLGWDVIHERNPRLVMTSITPFGQDGPYANWRATDLIGVAMGGLASLCGSPGRPPIRPSAAQGYTQACAQAVVGTMIAHYHRTRTGRGQRVDQSMQEAVTYHARQRLADLGHPRDQHRAARQRTQYRRLSERPVRLRSCRRARRSALLRRALRPDRSPDGRVARPPWHGRRPHLRGMDGQARRHAGRPAATRRPRWRPSQRRAGALLQALHRAQLVSEAQQIRNGWGIVHTPADLLENEHLAAREYWVEVEHEDIGERVTYPGPWAKLSATPLAVRGRAPYLGEHNQRGLRRSAGPLRRRNRTTRFGWRDLAGSRRLRQ